jgi:hypothetical protein
MRVDVSGQQSSSQPFAHAKKAPRARTVVFPIVRGGLRSVRLSAARDPAGDARVLGLGEKATQVQHGPAPSGAVPKWSCRGRGGAASSRRRPTRRSWGQTRSASSLPPLLSRGGRGLAPPSIGIAVRVIQHANLDENQRASPPGAADRTQPVACPAPSDEAECADRDDLRHGDHDADEPVATQSVVGGAHELAETLPCSADPDREPVERRDDDRVHGDTRPPPGRAPQLQ